MLIVADTGPVNYLISIGRIEILPILYEQVVIPSVVETELKAAQAPQIIAWVNNLPEWVKVMDCESIIISGLDAGESAAIILAERLRADYLLLDDLEARKEARKRGLNVAGTLAVIAKAAKEQLLDFNIEIDKLKQNSNFRITDEIITLVKTMYL